MTKTTAISPGTMNNPSHQIMTLPEVAEYLKISIEQVYRFINREKNPMPVILISDKTKRVRMADLQLWLSSQIDDDVMNEIIKRI